MAEEWSSSINRLVRFGVCFWDSVKHGMLFLGVGWLVCLFVVVALGMQDILGQDRLFCIGFL